MLQRAFDQGREYAAQQLAQKMAEEMQVPFLGRIPLDTKVAMAAEKGQSILDTGAGAAANAYKQVVSGTHAHAHTHSHCAVWSQ